MISVEKVPARQSKAVYGSFGTSTNPFQPGDNKLKNAHDHQNAKPERKRGKGERIGAERILTMDTLKAKTS